MNQADTNLKTQAILEIVEQEAGNSCIRLSGNWTLSNLTTEPTLKKRIKQAAGDSKLHWDLRSVNVLDSATALLLWQEWGQSVPVGLEIKPEHQRLLDKWQSQEVPDLDSPIFSVEQTAAYLSQRIWEAFEQLLNFIAILGQLVLDSVNLLRHPSDIPWSEISITVYDAGVRALGITALVGFLIGIVLSYLSALQLKLFGAEIYIIDILGLSVIRESIACRHSGRWPFWFGDDGANRHYASYGRIGRAVGDGHFAFLAAGFT